MKFGLSLFKLVTGSFFCSGGTIEFIEEMIKPVSNEFCYSILYNEPIMLAINALLRSKLRHLPRLLS